jgi:hypothetical protein
MLTWGWSMQVWVRCHEVVAKGGYHVVCDARVHSAMSVGDSLVRVSIKSGVAERTEPFFYDSAVVVAWVVVKEHVPTFTGGSVVICCDQITSGAACNLIAAYNETAINWDSGQRR